MVDEGEDKCFQVRRGGRTYHDIGVNIQVAILVFIMVIFRCNLGVLLLFCTRVSQHNMCSRFVSNCVEYLQYFGGRLKNENMANMQLIVFQSEIQSRFVFTDIGTLPFRQRIDTYMYIVYSILNLYFMPKMQFVNFTSIAQYSNLNC